MACQEGAQWFLQSLMEKGPGHSEGQEKGPPAPPSVLPEVIQGTAASDQPLIWRHTRYLGPERKIFKVWPMLSIPGSGLKLDTGRTG